MRKLTAAFLLAAAFAAAAPRAQETLGLGKMWTFEKPPLGYLKEEYGFEPTQEWLDMLRLASLRFGDWCSASFVSPQGLIMSNHHCMRDNVAKASPPDQDLVKNGFYAKALEDELPLPDVTVQQLVGMEDVTERINAGIVDGDDLATIAKKRAENTEKVLAAAKEAKPGFTPQVVALHQGAIHQLYTYKVYDDVRLVCAPHLQTAHFGGDPDNFTYPRWSIDFGFCRAYEDGKPADTSKHYFKWHTAGAKENEVVFVTGNPGSTGRLLTYAQMETVRDAEYPMQLDFVDSQLEIVRKFVERVPQAEKQLKPTILNFENSQKAIRGYLSGLLDPKLMAEKQAAEAAFRAKVDADPDAKAKYGKAWDELAALSKRKLAAIPKVALQTPSYSAALQKGLAIVNATSPDASEEERAAARAQVDEIEIRASHPLYDPLLDNHLRLAAKWLGKDDPYVVAILGDKEPAQARMALVRTKLRQSAYVAELLEGGHEAVAKSDDVAIVAARTLAPMMRANQKLNEEIEALESVLGSQIGLALFKVYGDGVSPDATMTLRFADGRVKGYPYNGTLAPYRTTFHGLYARNLEFDGKHPFDLPQVWLDRKDAVDLTKSVCFVSTNDIIGGNSGSPVVDKELRVVGLIFDGNIEQLPNRFLYRDTVQRSVSVHTESIIQSLRKIYDAGRLADELEGTTGNGEGGK